MLNMNKIDWLPNEPKPDLLGGRLEQLRSQLQDQDPEILSQRTGTIYRLLEEQGGEFEFDLWDQCVRLKFPELIAYDVQTSSELGGSTLAMILYYFATCDGTQPSGNWISFSELPDGRFYNQAFQGYTGGKLGQIFGNDFDLFCRVSEITNGGRVYQLGDAAYQFYVLPLVSLLLVTWRGDEDFNATYQVLFDETIRNHLPTDASAITGSILTGRLIGAMEKINENRN
jgi:hypothetical protein